MCYGPGPTPQREPTLDEVRGLGPELLDFEFAQPDQAEKDRRAKVIADLYNTALPEPEDAP